jgi:hypothetical protein
VRARARASADKRPGRSVVRGEGRLTGRAQRQGAQATDGWDLGGRGARSKWYLDIQTVGSGRTV